MSFFFFFFFCFFFFSLQEGSGACQHPNRYQLFVPVLIKSGTHAENAKDEDSEHSNPGGNSNDENHVRSELFSSITVTLCGQNY